MRCISVFVIAAFLTISTASAQPPDTIWTRTYGGTFHDHGRVVEQTDDGGFAVMGFSNSYGTSAFSRFWLVKTDNLGIVEWQSVYGPLFKTTYLHDGQQTSDGGYVLTGYIDNSVSPPPSDNDFYLVKTDTFGSVEWELIYGDTEFTETCKSVEQTMDEGYIMVGDSYSDGGTNDAEIFMAKVDAAGVVEWDAIYDVGTGHDLGRSVIQTPDGGYVILALAYYSSYRDVLILKTDSLGVMEWNVGILGPGNSNCEEIQQTSDGGFIVVGMTGAPEVGSEVWLIKLSPSGEMEWQNHYGGPYNDYGKSVVQTDDGGYLATGTVLTAHNPNNWDIYLVKTDSCGTMEWEAVYGGDEDDYGWCVSLTDEGGFAVVGSTTSFGVGCHDAWLIVFEDQEGISDGIAAPAVVSELAPNPFSGCLNITFELPENSQSRLSVYDLSGRLVEDLINTSAQAGDHTVFWNPAPTIPDGCYLIVLDACGQRAVRRAILLR